MIVAGGNVAAAAELISFEEAIDMQNQPGTGPRKRAPSETRHDRQAADLSEDAFKGGRTRPMPRGSEWLRNPWKPAGGRLWPRPESDEE